MEYLQGNTQNVSYCTNLRKPVTVTVKRNDAQHGGTAVSKPNKGIDVTQGEQNC